MADILQMSLKQVKFSLILLVTFKSSDFIPQLFVGSREEVHASRRQMLQKVCCPATVCVFFFFHTTSHSCTPSDNISHLKLKVLGWRQPVGNATHRINGRINGGISAVDTGL